MILDVSVTEYRYTITSEQVGLTRDRQTLSILRNQQVPHWYSSESQWKWQADLTAGRGFQWYVDKYSEVTTQNPWDDVELYFRRVQRAARVGPTQIPIPQSRLLYPANRPVLNTFAMASAAEAIAGWFCETHYNWNLYRRPLKVTPDMIFRDNQSRRLALVEVKSTSSLRNIRSKLTTEMINLLKVLAPTKLINPGRYYAGLIMVQVADFSEVHLTSLILEEV